MVKIENFFFVTTCIAMIVAYSSCKDSNPAEPSLGTGTFVSKETKNQNVLLEEYTGVSCGYCPDGHRIADSLAKEYKNNFFHINIHSGSMAAYYIIPEGEQLRQAFSISVFPAGVLNRQRTFIYSALGYGDYLAMRGEWGGLTKNTISKSAYLNIAAKAEIVNRTLTVKVQIYFTSDSKVGFGENYVNVALLQNNIWGTQSGGKELYPSMWNETKKQYKHNNVLRAMITGVSGESIGENTRGTFCEKIFIYDIPQRINNEDVVLRDISILAFVTEKTPSDAKTLPPAVINVCKSTLNIK